MDENKRTDHDVKSDYKLNNQEEKIDMAISKQLEKTPCSQSLVLWKL